MRIEYDPARDLLYVWFSQKGVKAAQTITVAPGVHADFDSNQKLIGLEVLDAAQVLGPRVEFGLELPVSPEAVAAHAA